MFALIPSAAKSWNIITHTIDLANQTNPNLYTYTVKPPLVHRKMEKNVGLKALYEFLLFITLVHRKGHRSSIGIFPLPVILEQNYRKLSIPLKHHGKIQCCC
jgi:hypothetical protein